MPQLHFYVSKDLAEKIQQEAKTADLSVSRYLANLVKREVATDWPERFFDEVVGGGGVILYSVRHKVNLNFANS